MNEGERKKGKKGTWLNCSEGQIPATISPDRKWMTLANGKPPGVLVSPKKMQLRYHVPP